MTIIPVSFPDACSFVKQYHRHHKKPQGHKFSLGLMIAEELVGVAIVGRPTARHNDDGYTLEVTRLCTNGSKNACSKLYSAAWRAVHALGFTRLITYILATENGASLRAANWRQVGTSRGGSWSRPSRPRIDSHPTGQKLLFAVEA